MKIDDLFYVHTGVTTTGLVVHPRPRADAIPFLRPAASQKRTIGGWVDRSCIADSKKFPSGSVFVSTNGEGSHSFAYVSSFEFACNSDVSVLVPKAPMTLAEKIFFARCITMNRFRFSYGRKPKGRRLKDVELPTFPESWGNLNFPSLSDMAREAFPHYTTGPDLEHAEEDGVADTSRVRLDSLFNISNGNGLDLATLERAAPHEGVRYISRKSTNNGVAAYVNRIDGIAPFSGGKLTCALSGEGGVLYTFLQTEPFYTSYHIACLTPIEPMTHDELLFYCACVKANRFKYSFGRQANRTLPALLVPARSAVPAFVSGALKRTLVALASED